MNAPLPIHPALQQQLNLTRVRAKLEPWLVAFYEHRLAGGFPEFTSKHLSEWVRKSVPDVAPESPQRVLRHLRDVGVVNYECVNRRQSRYRFLQLGVEPSERTLAEKIRELPSITSATEDRFWTHVTRGNGCWTWGGPSDRGYGTFGIGTTMWRAHRIAYELTYGRLPKGSVLLHTCDNPTCVNPFHLQPGTQAENLEDCRRKGRAKYVGEENGMSKIDEEDVEYIRAQLAAGRYQKDIATTLGVSQTLISQIGLGKKWAHVPESEDLPTIRKLREEVARLRELLEAAGVVDTEETP